MKTNPIETFLMTFWLIIRATEKKLKTSFATGAFWVIFAFLILLAEAYLTEMFTEFKFESLLILAILILVIGYVWVNKRKIMPKSVKV